MAQFDLLRHGRVGAIRSCSTYRPTSCGSWRLGWSCPLTPTKQLRGKPISRLNPLVALEGVQYAMLFQELAAIPAQALGDVVGNLRGRRAEIIAALDLLFVGI